MRLDYVRHDMTCIKYLQNLYLIRMTNGISELFHPVAKRHIPVQHRKGIFGYCYLFYVCYLHVIIDEVYNAKTVDFHPALSSNTKKSVFLFPSYHSHTHRLLIHIIFQGNFGYKWAPKYDTALRKPQIGYFTVIASGIQRDTVTAGVSLA